MAVDFELELVWIPVSDVDRAKRFYLEQVGFDLLVDTPVGLPGQRIVQVTPPGSACSIVDRAPPFRRLNSRKVRACGSRHAAGRLLGGPGRARGAIGPGDR